MVHSAVRGKLRWGLKNGGGIGGCGLRMDNKYVYDLVLVKRAFSLVEAALKENAARPFGKYSVEQEPATPSALDLKTCERMFTPCHSSHRH